MNTINKEENKEQNIMEELLSVINKDTSAETEKSDYVDMLELIKTPLFTKNIGRLGAKELMIISLKFGYINGKCFSNESIAKFLEIEEKEVITVTMKFLLNYKEMLNNLFDNFIDMTINENDNSKVLLKNTDN